MVEVTEAAQQQIIEYFKDKDLMPIRIFLNEGGWGGPSLAMALDEQKDSDDVYDLDGYQYIVDKDFLKKATPIKVDFKEVGFSVTSNIELSDGCSSCGTSDTCG